MGPEVFAGPAADSAVKTGISLIKQEAKYVFCFNTYVQNLKEKLHDLEVKKEGVLQHVEEGKRNNEVEDGEVTEWIKKVKEVLKARNEIYAKIDKHKCSCFRCGTVPMEFDEKVGSGSIPEVEEEKKTDKATGGFVLNPWTRSRTSRKAEELTKAVLELKDKTFDRYTRPGDPRGIVSGSYKDVDPMYYFPASRQTVLQDISKALSSSDIRIVGLWGPSGVGKSTLLNQLVELVKQEKFGCEFDEVAKATVSRTPDVERIQAELADWLGLRMLKEVSSVDSKAKELGNRLSDEKKKYLIILDDLARKIDLKKIGIPFEKDGKIKLNIKLLLTSRYEEVLQGEMTSNPNFKVEPFREEEAFELFKRSLDNYVTEDEETLKLIKGLLTNECAGLPLSINGLAIRLRSSPLFEWNVLLKNLQHSNDLGVKNFIDEMLESSFDVIDSKQVRSLFLLCGQIGTHIIPVDKLVIHGMGLGIFEGVDTIQKARDRVDTLLQKLKSYCLLEDEKPGFIKIHDRVSDVSLNIASKAQHSIVVRSGDEVMKAFIKEDLLRCKSISLLDAYDIKELPQGLSCPELNMFSLLCTEEHATKFTLPDAIFQNMKKLKVLELVSAALVPLPQSIQLLHYLQTLCLDSYHVEDWTFLGKLKRLQVLIVRKSKMVRLPKEIVELADLRVLDLRTCDGLEIIEQGILGSLTRLEELLLPESFEQWDKGGVRQPTNASLTELSNMPCLSALHIKIPDVTALANLPLVNLMRYSLYVGDKLDSDDESPAVHFDRERTLTLVLNSSNDGVIFEDYVQNASPKARELNLYGWVGIEKSVASLFKKGCTELKHANIQDCHTMEYIIDLNYQQTQFPSLESLYLENLINLEKIFLGGLLAVPFGTLKVITIKHCDGLRHLFPFSLMNNLQVLEEFEVAYCEMMQNIVAMDAEEGTAVQGEIMDSKREQLEFKALSKLSLNDLPKLWSFCTNQNEDMTKTDDNSRFQLEFLEDMIETDDDSRFQLEFLDGRQVSFPRLQSLLLSKLPRLRKVAHHQHPPNLQSLKSLFLDSCESLSIAIDSTLLLMLPNLEELRISNCNSMGEVFELEDELSINEVTKLGPISLMPDIVELDKLGSLKRIWNRIPKNISFVVNLRELKIHGCGQLAYLFSSSMAKSLKNLSHLSITCCTMIKGVFMEEMSSDENHTFDLPCLKELSIHSCDNMNSFIHLENESGDVPINQSFFSSKVLLPSLESLVLHKAGKFQRIWDSSISEQSFRKLTSLCVSQCDSVTVISPSIMVKELQELKEVEVKYCDNVEVIFESGEGNSMISKLNRMELNRLRSLKHVVRTNGTSNKTLLGFPSLNDIRIRDCESLINLFDTATAMTLSELKNLLIYDCRKMKEVVLENEGDENVERKMLAFDKLFYLELHFLDKLTHFCSGCSELYFPVLKRFQIVQCTNFKAFILKLANAVEQKDIDDSDNEDGEQEDTDDSGSEDGEQEDTDDSGSEDGEQEDTDDSGSKDGEQEDNDDSGNEDGEQEDIDDSDNEDGEQEDIDDSDNEDGVFSSLFDDKVMLPSLQELRIIGIKSKEIWHNKFLPGSFCKLQILEVRDCDRISVVIPSFMLHNLHNLEQLTVHSCKKVMDIFQLDGHTLRGRKLASSTVCKLKKINLYDLPNLQSLHKSESFPEYLPFHKLESIQVDCCNGLRNLFTSSTAKILKKLEELTVSRCEKIEEIVARENEDNAGEPYKIVFPQLSVLRLGDLKKLRTFCPAKHTTEWPSLKCIEIKYCSSVKAIVADSQEHVIPLLLVGKESWGTNKEGTDSENNKLGAFDHLVSILIVFCANLLTIFSSTIVGGFKNLEVLTVEHCYNLKDVFKVAACNEEEGIDSDNNKLGAFGKVKSILIKHCDNLSMIFPSTIVGGFKNLEVLTIESCEHLEKVFQLEDCNNESSPAKNIGFEKLLEIAITGCRGLERVFPTSVARCLQQLSTLKIMSCTKMKEIIARRGDCNKDDEKNASCPVSFFPRLTSLILRGMPNLESFYKGLHSTRWPLLQHLVVLSCPKAKILSSEQEQNNNHEVHLLMEDKGAGNNNEIPSFEATDIKMDMLQIPDEIIGNPTTLTLDYVKDHAALETFPWRLLLERPHNLQKLEIQCCDFAEIFPAKSSNGAVDRHGHESNEIVPSRHRPETGVPLVKDIRRLKLFDLRKIEHISWKEGSALADILDVVVELVVENCPLLTGILCACPSSAPASFNNLKDLSITYCNGLRYVLTSSTARCLVHLTSLQVDSCDNLEEIVADDDYGKDQEGRAEDNKDNKACDDITFHRLSILDLYYLSNLRCFSSISCNFNFPCLVKVYLFLEFCGPKELRSLEYYSDPDPKKLEFFCKGIAKAPLLSEKQRRQVGIQF